MSENTHLRLFPYYINSRRLCQLCGVAPLIEAQESLSHNSQARARAMGQLSGLATDAMRKGVFPNLASVGTSALPQGAIAVGMTWGLFCFRGAKNAFAKERQGKSFTNASFSGEVTIDGRNFDVVGDLYNEHFYSTSSLGMLTGRKRMLVAGQFQFDGDRITAFPHVIGDLTNGSVFQISWSNSVRVHPSSIDAFRGIEKIKVSKGDISELQNVSEDNVKNIFAEILGEHFVPRDWGGERSDLLTSRITLDGLPTTAAFIFKGPSLKGEMHPGNMGKRGDQLIRAFDEPADLIVIQHCNKIANNVIRTAESLAYDLRHPRKYCIIDGHDTARILKLHKARVS